MEERLKVERGKDSEATLLVSHSNMIIILPQHIVYFGMMTMLVYCCFGIMMMAVGGLAVFVLSINGDGSNDGDSNC